eukprot:2606033-Amphidinium_carterae.1
MDPLRSRFRRACRRSPAARGPALQNAAHQRKRMACKCEGAGGTDAPRNSEKKVAVASCHSRDTASLCPRAQEPQAYGSHHLRHHHRVPAIGSLVTSFGDFGDRSRMSRLSCRAHG